jgi:hypothetical protein
MTLAGLAALVVLLAVDSGLLRYVATPDDRGMPGNGLKAFLLVVIPVVNVLILGLPRLIGRGVREASFLAGFEAAGWAAILLYGISCPLFPVATSNFFVWIFPPIYNTLARHSAMGNIYLNIIYMWFIMFPACSLALSLPLWGVAICGGLLGRKVAGVGPRSHVGPVAKA